MSKKNISGRSLTDLERLDKMSDSNIDFSDISEVSPQKFAQAVVRKCLKPLPSKAQVTLRIDSDVLEWFKGKGKRYQTRINRILRAYMEECQGSPHRRDNKEVNIDN
ncbi:MAG: BrnA antitoxin family protein [Desulfobacterales bacterium]